MDRRRRVALAVVAAALAAAMVSGCSDPVPTLLRALRPAPKVEASPLLPQLQTLFGARLGRVKQTQPQLAMEIKGGVSERELFQALVLLVDSTPRETTLAVIALLPDDGWKTRMLVWNRAIGRLDSIDGEAGEWLVTAFPPGASAAAGMPVEFVGFIPSGIDAARLHDFATGKAAPAWEKPLRSWERP